jgi:hypothetical protein
VPASTAAGATTNWTVGFTTSSSGALAYPSGTVTLTLPSGTTLGSFDYGTVTDTTTGQTVSNNCSNTSGTTVTCTLDIGNPVNAGDVVSVVLDGVTNPTTTGSATTTVSTSSDTKAATKAVTITAAQAITHLSVVPTSTSAGATTNWTVGFTSSSTGALVYPSGTVMVALPSGTGLGSFYNGTVTDTTTGQTVGDSCSNTSGTTVTCTLNYGPGYTVNAGDVVSVVLNDVTNPTATGSATTSVSTSSDTVPTTKAVTITAAQAVTGLSIVLASSAASATTNWTVGFTTSTTGALAYPGSTITIGLPSGTTLGSFDGGSVTDTTTGQTVSNSCSNTSGTTVTCTLNYGNTVNAGDVVSVVLDDVTNPTATGSATTTVSTSSDKAATKNVTITAAQAITHLSVVPTSTAAGATANWTVGFTTSSTGALVYPGSTVTVALPSGTGLGSFYNGTVTDTTTGQTVSSSCSNTSGTTVTCTLNYGNTVNAGDVLSVVLNDVTNPTSTGSASTTVSTSSDTVLVTKSVTVTAAQAITNLSVVPTSTAAGATTNWTVGFTTSSTGALVYPGSAVTVTFPGGTTLGSFDNGTITDTTTGQTVSSSCSPTSGTTVTCTLNYGNTVNAGDVLSVVLDDVTNPTATGSATTTVSTSSDTTAVTKSVTITAAQALTHLSVVPTSTAAGATANWTVGFTASSTGALVYPGSTVTVALPSGTGLGSFYNGTITDTTTGQTVSNSCSPTSGTTVSCTLNYGNTVNGGDVVSVVLDDVTNPTTTGSGTTTVSTSSDKAATKSVTITAAQAVAGLSVVPASTAAGATTNWTVGFTTSSTGDLVYPRSTITMALPSGTTFGSFDGGTVTDTTTGQAVSYDCSNPSGTTVTCTLDDYYATLISAGDVISVVLDGVTNPTTTGSATTTVSTSSDTVPVTKSVTITGGQAVTGLSVVPTSTAAGASTNWTVGFTTSPTGALAYPGGTITTALPSGTALGSFDGGTVSDTTTGQTVSNNCSPTSGTTVTCTLNDGNPVNAGDVLSVVLDGVTNPTATGPATSTVSTSSDTSPVTQSVTITAAQAVTGLSVVPTSTAAGAPANWTVGFTASSTGALVYPASTVTVALPSGTGLGSFYDGTVTDTTTGQTVSSNCSPTSGTTVTCTLNYGNTVNAGDVVSVVLEDVTNPTATGSATTTVSTSSDTVPVTTSFTLTAAQAVTSLSVVPTSTSAGATTNWTVGFTTSSTGALTWPGSTITMALPSGTTFGSFGGGTVTDTTTGQPVSYDCSHTSGTTVTCRLDEYYGSTISAGDAVSVALDDVTNPTATGSATTTVSTSSDTVATTQSVTITGAQGPVCGKLSGSISGTITITKCTPTSASYKTAKGPASALTTSGTFKWASSGKTTIVSDTLSSPGQGSCAAGSIERDIAGSVTGGSAKKYTKVGYVVSVRMCQNGSGKLSLVPGTKAIF